MEQSCLIEQIVDAVIGSMCCIDGKDAQETAGQKRVLSCSSFMQFCGGRIMVDRLAASDNAFQQISKGGQFLAITTCVMHAGCTA